MRLRSLLLIRPAPETRDGVFRHLAKCISNPIIDPLSWAGMLPICENRALALLPAEIEPARNVMPAVLPERRCRNTSRRDLWCADSGSCHTFSVWLTTWCWFRRMSATIEIILADAKFRALWRPPNRFIFLLVKKVVLEKHCDPQLVCCL